jgi:hypothetical protein
MRGVTVAAVERIADALEARLVIDLQWQGADLDRLLDARHAGMIEWLAALLRGSGWDPRPEVSFNHFGDRGRYDLIAFHSASQIALVVEAKTSIGDMQDLLGRLDVKVRLARQTAHALGWRPSSIVPLLLLAEDSTNRRLIGAHATLFERFNLRGPAAKSWVGRPRGNPQVPAGLLLFTKLPDASHRGVMTRRRVKTAAGRR